MVKQILLFISAALCCAAQTPSVTCSANTAQEGQSVTCTSSAPVNWSLASGGVGTLSNQTSTTVTYTAPASVVPLHAMAGCPVFPNDSVFNTRIDSLPLDSNSTNYASNAGSLGISFLPSWGITLADDSTPTGTIKQFYGSNVVNNNFVLPNTPALKREGGAWRSHWDTGDHHQMVVRTTDCSFWEIYNRLVPGVDFPPTENCQNGDTGCNAASAIDYSWSDYGLLGGTDAAGLPLAPLSLHLDEIKAGAVNHPMRFTSCAGCIYYSAILWPAVANNGCGGTNVNGNPCSYSPPMGARFRLRLCDGSSVTSNCVNLSSYSAYAQTVLTALHQYGMFMADIGGEGQITTATDVTEDAAVGAALASISGIPMTDFEVVDETYLMYNSGSLQTCPYNSTTCGPSGDQTNSYEQPNGQVIVVATPTGGGASANTTIVLQGIAIGLNANNLFVEPGSYSFSIPSWVTGTSNQAVTWTLVSGVGSVTSAGVYTVPTSTSGGTSATLKVTSAADANATAFVYITILPLSSNPPNSLRIDVGGGGQTDGNGNVWQPDEAFETGASILTNGDYPGWFDDNAASNPEIAVYQSEHYTYGNDLVYSFMAPNGNYKVRLMFGRPYDGQSASITTFGHQYSGRMDLEAQGQIAAHNFDYGMNQPPGYSDILAIPSDAYIPAQVTNNILQVAIRGVFFSTDYGVYGAQCGGCFAPALDGLEIIPDTTSTPHWAIDTQQTTNVSPGRTLQLYQVDWYTGLSDVQWSIVSGPGSISSAGLYTAPTMQPSAGTAVTVVAQSASTPGVSATTTLFITGTAVDIK